LIIFFLFRISCNAFILCKPILYPESLVEKRIGKIKTVQDRKIWKEIMKTEIIMVDLLQIWDFINLQKENK
jgi:hypothetical protein